MKKKKETMAINKFVRVNLELDFQKRILRKCGSFWLIYQRIFQTEKNCMILLNFSKFWCMQIDIGF